MINGKRVICVIPARGGSKSIPDKNLQILGDKPLLKWPIDLVKKCKFIDRIIISTDNLKISKLAKDNNCEVYKRPSKLSTDTSLVEEALKNLHKRLLIEGETSDIMILLEATSPFRSLNLIEKCLKRFVKENLDSIATFNEADINPERTWEIVKGVPKPFIKKSIPWKPRQKLKMAYQLNGLVYIFKPSMLHGNKVGLLFGKSSAEITKGHEVIDIDTKKDLLIANLILKEGLWN